MPLPTRCLVDAPRCPRLSPVLVPCILQPRPAPSPNLQRNCDSPCIRRRRGRARLLPATAAAPCCADPSAAATVVTLPPALLRPCKTSEQERGRGATRGGSGRRGGGAGGRRGGRGGSRVSERQGGAARVIRRCRCRVEGQPPAPPQPQTAGSCGVMRRGGRARRRATPRSSRPSRTRRAGRRPASTSRAPPQTRYGGPTPVAARPPALHSPTAAPLCRSCGEASGGRAQAGGARPGGRRGERREVARHPGALQVLHASPSTAFPAQ